MKMHIMMMLYCMSIINTGLYAADEANSSAARLYPFSDLDKMVFRNDRTKKIESPYSTASVLQFSKDSLVMIEKIAYEELLDYAKERSDAVGNVALERYEKYKREVAGDEWKKIMSMSTRALLEFNLVKAVVNPFIPQNSIVQVSERDLMHILQWTHGIETEWGTKIENNWLDFQIYILLNDREFIAPRLLRDFILRVNSHDQENKSRWIGDTDSFTE